MLKQAIHATATVGAAVLVMLFLVGCEEAATGSGNGNGAGPTPTPVAPPPPEPVASSCATAAHPVRPPSWLHGSWVPADDTPGARPVWRFSADNVQGKFDISQPTWVVDLKYAHGSGIPYLSIIRDESTSTKYLFVQCRIATGELPEGWTESHWERQEDGTVAHWTTSDQPELSSAIVTTWRRIAQPTEQTIPTKKEISSGEKLIESLRGGGMDPVMEQMIRSVQETVPAMDLQDFLNELGGLRLDRPVSEMLSNRSFRTLLRIIAPVYDQHYGAVSTVSLAAFEVQQESSENGYAWANETLAGFSHDLAEIIKENQTLLLVVAVSGCVLTKEVCLVAIGAWLAFKVISDKIVEENELATDEISRLDHDYPCTVGSCEAPGIVNDVHTQCVDVENFKTPYAILSVNWRTWEWDFVNNCGESVWVHWGNRSTTGLNGWSDNLYELSVGDRDSNSSTWAQDSDPPNPVTVWCASVSLSSRNCSRENDYLTDPTNWRELRY
ncbi:MAG: hypothetical protein OXQ89_09615 [Rhodospirillaceae bacterium]|nr:hypothetical protein [Rhodospirillaceae bacterium]MDE0361973.1 hypothetical protein [Rhodospirillaceae bacterium]